MGQPGVGPIDPTSFERVVEEFADRVFSIALRITGSQQDAEDALQETFLSAYRNWGQFRGEAALSTWLYRIAVNAALQRVRQRPPVAPLEESGYDATDVPDWSSELPGRVEELELYDRIEEGLLRLPEDYRLAVVLRDVEGLSTAEAAETLEISEAALKSRLHRGRVLLRQYLERYLFER